MKSTKKSKATIKEILRVLNKFEQATTTLKTRLENANRRLQTK